MSELIDVIDPATGAVERTLSRRAVHAEGHWHRVFHCMLIRPSTRTLILQRRASTKAAFPDKLDLSVTGHLAAGETPLDGVREAEEELGVSINRSDLVPVGTRLLADDTGEGRNREMVHLYFLADERPLESFRPPMDEVHSLVEVAIGDLLALLADGGLVVPAQEFVPGRPSGPSSMRRDDLVDGTSGYWVVLASMADRFVRGEAPLAI